MLNISRIDCRDLDAREAVAQLRRQLAPQEGVVSEAGRKLTQEVFGEPLAPPQVVERICRDVRQEGLAAVLKYTSKLDRVNLDAATIRVSQRELDEAKGLVEPAFLETVRRVRDRIQAFQQAVLHYDVEVALPHGGYLRERYVPLERVGICVPGGAAAYPSTVLMTVVPAQVAGVRQLAVVAPPTKFGANNPHLLATCRELGVDEVYRLGGAQAVAALAYGMEGLERVDKIVGPGNQFVALAKRLVYGEVDIDAVAGPSEIVVLADDPTHADYVAADLIAQAEHAPGSSILLSWNVELLERVKSELSRQLATLSRGNLAVQSLETFGALVRTRDVDQAVAMANLLAPEHLHIATTNAEEMAPRIVHAGAVFLGPYSPVALGDYVAGPSHVLPTDGTARFASGLTANTFLRSMSVIRFSQQDLMDAAEDVARLADQEGLTAHRASVDVRRAQREGE